MTDAKQENGVQVEEKRAPKKAARKGDGETEVLDAIAEMVEPDRTTSARLHALIKTNAPTLVPRLWYGMPAYARNGKVICFFRSTQKFKERYMTLGFNEGARLDEGALWPIAYALKELTPAEEEEIGALIRKAVS